MQTPLTRRRFIRLTAAGTASAALFGPRLTANPAPSRGPLNLLFIMTDQQFAEAMSCAGSPWVRTPNMDRIAARGLRFEQAYPAQPLCAPCRTSIQTGRWPGENGCTTNALQGVRLPKRFPLLGARIREAGYDTAYFGKWHVPVRGEARHGYRVFDTHPVYGRDHAHPAGFARYLEERPAGRPFFATVSLHNPHDICQHIRDQELPEGPVDGELPPVGERPPLPGAFETPDGYPEMIRKFRASEPARSRLYPTGDWSGERWREYLWTYYRLVEKVDREVGRVLDALEESGEAGNTAILFISDHGEGLGLHRWTQKQAFVETSARIPFILSVPGLTEDAPVDRSRLVSTLDIYPTLCELAGAALPGGLGGRSLIPLLQNDGKAPWRDHVVSETEFSFARPTGLHGRMVRSERFKYALYSEGGNREWLVDLREDPGETLNLAADPACAGTLEQHRGWLRRWAEATGDRRFARDPLLAYRGGAWRLSQKY